LAKLHEFDLFACRELHSTIHGNLDNERFVEVFSRLSRKLREYLHTDPYPDDDQASTPQLLLSDSDFAEIYEVFHATHRAFGTWRWRRSPLLRKRAIRCLREIKAGLTAKQAVLWEKRSDRYELQLKKKPLRLDQGIKVIWNWVENARELLIALGHTELVPVPHGQFPTPTYSTNVQLAVKGHQKSKAKTQSQADARTISNAEELEAAYGEQLRLLRQTISQRGKDTKVDNLIKGMGSRQLVRDLLRYLEWRGEYSGWARPRSVKYPSPWPWLDEPFTGSSG
jgi:hypothetical protein